MSDGKNYKDRNYETGLLFQTLRKKAKLRQSDIAEMVGVGSSTVEYWESGTTYPRVETLKKLFELYLNYHLFSRGRELVEAEEIWESIRHLAPRFNGRFDREWFETLLNTTSLYQEDSKQQLPYPYSESSSILYYLPERLTSFVGRKKELATLTAWLQPGKKLLPGRLLTLTGAGGCGKTSLALETVRKIAGQYQQMVRLVELEAITTPSGVVQALGTSLGLKEQPGSPLLTTITDYLREKQLLLILDNCEQVVKECARLVNGLLKDCPNLIVLATSRESLQVTGEHVFRVPSLSLPPLSTSPSLTFNSKFLHNQTGAPDLRLPEQQTAELLEYEAVQLFVDRAKSVNLHFRLNDQVKAVVVELCQRLDGIPLAIELAAARLRMLDIFQLNERLADRFRVLRSGSDRNVLPHHQTLRATVEWSYELLSEPERLLFRQLSVFAGGWHLEAAENICLLSGFEQAEILDLLNDLVNKSLVIVEEDLTQVLLVGSASRLVSFLPRKLRFRLLETLREFGREQLEKTPTETIRQGEPTPVSEKPEMQTRHLLYFADFAARCVPEDSGDQPDNPGTGLESLNGEYANLRAALDWSCDPRNQAFPDRHLPVALELACAVARLWVRLNYLEEACDYLSRLKERALSAGLSQSAEYAWTCNWLGRFRLTRGDFNQANTIHLETLDLFMALEDKRGIMLSLYYLGLSIKHQGENRKAIELHQQSLVLATGLGDKTYRVRNMSQLGYIYNELGEYNEAENHIQAAFKEVREIGDPGEIADCLIRLSPGLIFQGKYETANNYLQESIPLLQETGDKSALSKSLGNLGYLAYVQGFKEKAAYYFKEAYFIQKEVGTRDSMAMSLSNLAGLSVETGNYEEANRFNKDALVLYQEIGDRLGVALCLNTSSMLDLSRKDYEAALEKLKKALVLFKDLEEKSHVIESILGLADITQISYNELAREDPESANHLNKNWQSMERSARLAGVAIAISASIGLKLPTSYQEIFDRVTEGARSKLAETDFERIFAEGQGLPFEEAIAYALN